MRKNFKKSVYSSSALAMVLAASANTQAVTQFNIGDWEATWTTKFSLGTSIRAEEREQKLYSAINARAAGISGGAQPNIVDEGNLNYDKGDAFSTLAKVISEVEFKNGDMGGLIRVKGWYDYTLNKESVHYGHQPNGYNGFQITQLDGEGRITNKRPLSDNDFDEYVKFDGISLMDAYFYSNHYIGDNAMQVRIGKQVLNWGESLFFQGVNQINPIDLPAFRRPGAELKEVFMPQWIASMNMDLPNGDTFAVFYQLRWDKTPIEGTCGNYWSVAAGTLNTSPATCYNAISLAGNGGTGPQVGAFVGTHDVSEPADDGQFGAAYWFRPEAVDAEIGFFAMNIHSRIPTMNLKFSDPDLLPDLQAQGLGGTLSPMGYNISWEYPEDIKIYGISVAGNPYGISVSAELNHTVDFPAQLDGNDMLLSAFGFGPLAGYHGSSAAAMAPGSGVSPTDPAGVPGYVLTDKTQFQVNFLKVDHGLLGEDQYIFVAEVAFQHNTLAADYEDMNSMTGKRFNRGFPIGPGPSPMYGGSTCGVPGLNPNGTPGCDSVDGYVTNDAWGYKMKLQLQYNNILMNGLTWYPSLYWSHDVDGYSVDSQLLEDRTALNLGLKLSYQKQYEVEFNYAMFGNRAKMDVLRDRDFYSVNFGVTF